MRVVCRVFSLVLLLATLAVLGACASEEVANEPDTAPLTVTETVEAGATDEATIEEATTEDVTTEEAEPEPEPEETAGSRTPARPPRATSSSAPSPARA